jgi:hypothetical protein
MAPKKKPLVSKDSKALKGSSSKKPTSTSSSQQQPPPPSSLPTPRTRAQKRKNENEPETSSSVDLFPFDLESSTASREETADLDDAWLLHELAVQENSPSVSEKDETIQLFFPPSLQSNLSDEQKDLIIESLGRFLDNETEKNSLKPFSWGNLLFLYQSLAWNVFFPSPSSISGMYWKAVSRFLKTIHIGLQLSPSPSPSPSLCFCFCFSLILNAE